MSTSVPFAEARAELWANLRLAGPVVMAQVTLMSFGVADVLMVGRLGAVPLAAIAIGSNLWMQLFVLFMGICMAVSPIIAHRVGGGESVERIAAFVRGSLVVALLLGVLWALMTRVIAAPVIGWLGMEAETARLAWRYLLAESWSAPFLCVCFVLRYAAEGMGAVNAVLIAGMAGLLVKVGANLLLIFGLLGAPELGVVGAGWATVVASVVMALVYIQQFQWRRRLGGLHLWRPGERIAVHPGETEILRLGIPIGLILFAEAAFFGGTALLMARFGEAAVAAHQVAINFVSVSFMVPLGVALATTVRVGYAAGAGMPGAALLRGKVGMAVGVAYALVSAAVMGLRPDLIVSLYTDDPRVVGAAETFLRYGALFQVFDCLQVTANGALRGLKDTRLPMLITLTAYWVCGLPAAYVLAFSEGYGPVALWWGLILGLALAAGGLSWRFWSYASARSLPGGVPR